MADTEALLRNILENGPLALRACLEAVDAGLETSLDQALLLEANHFGLLSATGDMREGTKAFLEKRKPVFKGI
jgi:enoyl-CoA hydratase